MAKLIDYLQEAREFNREQLNSQDRWRSPLFEFVRAAKAHPRLKNIPASKAVQLVLAEITRHGGTEAWFPDSCDPASELWETWDRVIAIDEDPLSFACMNARRRPLAPQVCPSEKYRLFISLAYHLQVFRGSASVMLPVKKLADILGVDFRTVSTYRKLAERQGLMTLQSGHIYSEKKASEFVFHIELFDSRTLVQTHWNQDKQDAQDNQDNQDLQENKDKQGKQNTQEFSAEKEQVTTHDDVPRPRPACPGPFSPAEMEEKKRQAFEVAKRLSAGS
jgi:hypothetical protein